MPLSFMPILVPSKATVRFNPLNDLIKTSAIPLFLDGRI